MNSNLYTLNSLPLGKKATVEALNLQGPIRRRILDLGLIPGTIVEALHKSPLGEPTAYNIRGAVVALRSEEASKIYIQSKLDIN